MFCTCLNYNNVNIRVSIDVCSSGSPNLVFFLLIWKAVETTCALCVEGVINATLEPIKRIGDLHIERPPGSPTGIRTRDRLVSIFSEYEPREAW